MTWVPLRASRAAQSPRLWTCVSRKRGEFVGSWQTAEGPPVWRAVGAFDHWDVEGGVYRSHERRSLVAAIWIDGGI